MNKVRSLAMLSLAMVLAAVAHASTDPVADVTAAGTTAQTSWSTFAAISASAFVFGMVIGYARKGKK